MYQDGKFHKIISLQSVLRSEHCVGILGGTPGHALFLIGYQGEKKTENHMFEMNFEQKNEDE